MPGRTAAALPEAAGQTLHLVDPAPLSARLYDGVREAALDQVPSYDDPADLVDDAVGVAVDGGARPRQQRWPPAGAGGR